MTQYVLVSSLSHSGSTITALTVARHANCITLGEVYQVLRERPSDVLANTVRECSCGESAASCSFWGPLLTRLTQVANVKLDEELADQRYLTLVEEFERQFGRNKHLIDTSKGIKHLSAVSNLAGEVNIKPLYLVRDVRAYATSQTRLARSEKRTGIRRVKRNIHYQFLRWFAHNRKRIKMFRVLDKNTLFLSYEAFCLDHSQTMKNIYRFLGLEVATEQSDGNHHVLIGNPMRNKKKGRHEVFYDYRWLSNSEINAPGWMYPFVMRLNKSYYEQYAGRKK